MANSVTASPTKAPHFGPTGRIFSVCSRGALVASFVFALAAVPMCYCWQPFAANTPAVASTMNGNASTPPVPAHTQVVSSNRQDARLAALHQDIVVGETRASNMEAELRELESEADGLKRTMNALKARIVQDERDNRNGLQMDADAYNSAIDNYNSLVPKWNQLLADRSHKRDAYSAQINQINKWVDEYNVLIGAQP